MNAEQLKNSILQRAIEGKLVEQREEEGTAAELLREIRAEKARLVKEGKLKKEKLLRSIKAEEIPFEIPESWEWVRLPELVYLVGNKENQILAKEVKPSGKYAAVSQGQKLIDGYADCKEKVVSDIPAIMFGDHTRNVKYIDFPFVISADGTKFMKPICIDALYLYHWMTLAAEQLRNRGYARHFSLLKEKIVPIPPLAEQKRIVAKIEELLPRVEQYGKAHDELTALNEKFPDAMKKSVLQYAMEGKLVEQRKEEGTAKELLSAIKAEKAKLVKEGKLKKEKSLPEIKAEEIPFEIPESWEWVHFADIALYVSTGPFGTMLHKSDYCLDGTPLVNPSHMIDGKIIPANNKRVNQETLSRLASYKLQENDIVLARRGELGRCAVVSRKEAGWLCGTGSFFVHFGDGIFPQFIYSFFQSHYVRSALLKSSVGTTMNNLNHSILNNLRVPLPPLAEQKRIVAKIEELVVTLKKR